MDEVSGPAAGGEASTLLHDVIMDVRYCDLVLSRSANEDFFPVRPSFTCHG